MLKLVGVFFISLVIFLFPVLVTPLSILTTFFAIICLVAALLRVYKKLEFYALFNILVYRYGKNLKTSRPLGTFIKPFIGTFPFSALNLIMLPAFWDKNVLPTRVFESWLLIVFSFKLILFLIVLSIIQAAAMLLALFIVKAWVRRAPFAWAMKRTERSLVKISLNKAYEHFYASLAGIMTIKSNKDALEAASDELFRDAVTAEIRWALLNLRGENGGASSLYELDAEEAALVHILTSKLIGLLRAYRLERESVGNSRMLMRAAEKQAELYSEIVAAVDYHYSRIADAQIRAGRRAPYSVKSIMAAEGEVLALAAKKKSFMMGHISDWVIWADAMDSQLVALRVSKEEYNIKMDSALKLLGAYIPTLEQLTVPMVLFGALVFFALGSQLLACLGIVYRFNKAQVKRLCQKNKLNSSYNADLGAFSGDFSIKLQNLLISNLRSETLKLSDDELSELFYSDVRHLVEKEYVNIVKKMSASFGRHLKEEWPGAFEKKHNEKLASSANLAEESFKLTQNLARDLSELFTEMARYEKIFGPYQKEKVAGLGRMHASSIYSKMLKTLSSYSEELRVLRSPLVVDSRLIDQLAVEAYLSEEVDLRVGYLLCYTSEMIVRMRALGYASFNFARGKKTRFHHSAALRSNFLLMLAGGATFKWLDLPRIKYWCGEMHDLFKAIMPSEEFFNELQSSYRYSIFWDLRHEAKWFFAFLVIAQITSFYLAWRYFSSRNLSRSVKKKGSSNLYRFVSSCVYDASGFVPETGVSLDAEKWLLMSAEGEVRRALEELRSIEPRLSAADEKKLVGSLARCMVDCVWEYRAERKLERSGAYDIFILRCRINKYLAVKEPMRIINYAFEQPVGDVTYLDCNFSLEKIGQHGEIFVAAAIKKSLLSKRCANWIVATLPMALRESSYTDEKNRRPVAFGG